MAITVEQLITAYNSMRQASREHSEMFPDIERAPHSELVANDARLHRADRLAAEFDRLREQAAPALRNAFNLALKRWAAGHENWHLRALPEGFARRVEEAKLDL